MLIAKIQRGKISRAALRCIRFDLPSKRLGLLALCQRNIAVHLLQGRRCLRQPCAVGQRQQRIGAHPVFRSKIGVEMGKAKDILRTGIAALGSGLDQRHRLVFLTLLEQQQAIVVGSLDMAPLSRLSIKIAGKVHIGFNPAPEAIGLRKVKQRICIAGLCRPTPFGNGGREIALTPGINACLDISSGRNSCDRKSNSA